VRWKILCHQNRKRANIRSPPKTICNRTSQCVAIGNGCSGFRTPTNLIITKNKATRPNDTALLRPTPIPPPRAPTPLYELTGFFSVAGIAGGCRGGVQKEGGFLVCRGGAGGSLIAGHLLDNAERGQGACVGAVHSWGQCLYRTWLFKYEQLERGRSWRYGGASGAGTARS